MCNHTRGQRPFSEKVRNTPQHPEDSSRRHDSQCRQQPMYRLAKVGKAERNSRNNNLGRLAVSCLGEVGHEQPAEEEFLTVPCSYPREKRGSKVESRGGKSIVNRYTHARKESNIACNCDCGKKQRRDPRSPVAHPL